MKQSVTPAALRRALLATAVSAVLVGIAVSPAAAAQASSATIAFDLPAQPLSRALQAYGQRAQRQIIYTETLVADLRAPALQGNYTAEEALERLLEGTTLVAERTPDGVIMIKRAAGAETRDPPGGDDARTLDEVLVTGSRFAQRVIDSPAPVVAITAEQFLGRTGRTSLGDELSELPQFRATTTQQATGGLGTGPSQVGLNLLDLRGLGTARTLVLQNGRRHVSSSQSVAQPDVNTIPTDLLERVEILTGGASAVYGADAIAGVVNFVLKDDFEGLTVRGQAGTSSESDADTRSLSVAGGLNFAEGRGNVAGSLEYAKRELLEFAEREFSRGQYTFVPNPADTDPTRPPGSPPDGIPDQILIGDLRLLLTSPGGTFFNNFLGGAPRAFRFAPNGTLNPADLGARSFFPPVPVTEGGDGFSSVATASLIPRNERIALNLIGHYDLSDTWRAFGEAKIVDIESQNFTQPSSSSLTLSLANPYLSAQARSVLQANLPPGSTSFPLSRVNDDLGSMGDETQRRTYRGVVGLRGDLSSTWKIEAAYTYGRTDVDTRFANNLLNARMALAANAVRDTTGVLGTPGAIVCAARLAAGGTATGNADVDGCVPANVFGSGALSAQAIDYLRVDTQAEGTLEQNLVTAFVTGDTSAFLTLPAGPIGVVAGLEYRSDSTDYRPDPRDASGQTQLSGIPTKGSLNVREAYGEFRVPLVADVPAIERLELSAAVRVADYSIDSVGTKTSWGTGLVWQPVGDLRVRGSYQRAIRSPNLSELFNPVNNTFFGLVDPCTASALNSGTTSRPANCAALGRPANFVANTLGRPVPGSTGGNPALDVETAKTWTAGFAYAPAAVPGLTATIDYYDIELDDAIALLQGGILAQQCVDGPSIDNAFCPLIARDASFNIVRIDQRPINLARLTAAGVDLDTRYRFALAGPWRADLRLLGTYVVDRDDYLNPSRPDVQTQVVETVGSPRLSLNLGANVGYGPVELSYTVRHATSQYRGPVEDFEDVGGRPARNPDSLPPEYRKTGDYTVHDLRVGYTAFEGVELYVGVDNLTDETPPLGLTGTGANGGALFDNLGRFFYAGLRWDVR